MHAVRLLLALHVNYQFTREAFLGIAEEARTYGNIVMRLKLGHETIESSAAALRAHAIIAAPINPAEREAVLAIDGIPKVCIANLLDTHQALPVVGNDDNAVGRLVAATFLNLGFRHFGFFMNSDAAYFLPRRAAFFQALAEVGHCCNEGPTPTSDERVNLDRLADWLTSLPKPVAIFCPYDGHARDVLAACKLADLPVPGAVSVMGVDNDPIECLSTSPTLSSVATAAAEIGREALNLVLSMLRGEAPPSHPRLIPPHSVAFRESCGERAIDDEDVAAAVTFIRRNLRERITVGQIARRVAVSPRTLQRKFEDVLHACPLDEIRRARIAHAKQLLAGTDLGLAEIARRSGMIRAQRLASLIKNDTGMTALQFRKRNRGNWTR